MTDTPYERGDRPDLQPRYTPREGVDYINDFYALADVPRDADNATVKRALDRAIRKYHPDRVDGLADEFKDRASVISPLLLRARELLLDPDRRADYDQLLEEWNGPISMDGTPTITMDRMAQAQASMLGSEGARELIDGVDAQIGAMVGFEPKKLEAAQRMADKYPDDPDVRAALEAELLENDRLLALRETKRRELAGAGEFGIEQINENGYRVGLGYAERVAKEIEGARDSRFAHEHWLAVGGAVGRLAITGGEGGDTPAPQGGLLPAEQTQVSLPPVFEAAVDEITQIAAQREELLIRRLDNLMLTYPEAEAQTEVRDNLIVGFGDPDNPTWLGFNRNLEASSIDELLLNEETTGLLARGEFTELINRGYGIALSPVLEQVETMALLDAVLNKYYSRGQHPTETNSIRGS